MDHTIEVVEVKEMSDDQVAYRVRCCGDEKTDSWCTTHVTLPDDEHDAALQAHKDRVQTTHEAKVKWRKKHGL